MSDLPLFQSGSFRVQNLAGNGFGDTFRRSTAVLPPGQHTLWVSVIGSTALPPLPLTIG